MTTLETKPWHRRGTSPHLGRQTTPGQVVPPPPPVDDALFESDSPAMEAAIAQVRQAAPLSVPVLIQGETGTGKELLARLLHQSSTRAQESFVAVNCAAIPGELLEGELFGHERGAFTGAHARRIGKFEAAGTGTLVLDEIGELPPALQGKLLRAVQEREFEPLGGNRIVRFGGRVVAATSRDLEHEVREGRFRADLYYRLAVVRIEVPPLRRRLEDLPRIANRLLGRHAQEQGEQPKILTSEMLGLLARHTWPGNVRELQNVLVSAAIRSPGRDIVDLHIPSLPTRRRGPSGTCTMPLPSHPGEVLPLDEYESRVIRAALAATDGNISDCARRLGIGRATLRRKLAAMPEAP